MPFYQNRDYLMSLYTRFCPAAEEDPETVAAAEELWQTLSVTQRKLLLEFEDRLYEQHDASAFNSFVSGFRVAVGIAIELRNEWYSFTDDEEHRAREAFEAERDTMIQNKERNQNHE